MNYRVSFILLVLVTVVGGYVLIFELQRQPERTPQTPWFYDISPDDITSISITFGGQRQAFVKTDQGWVFEDTGEPVNKERWGGVTLLLSGPRTARVVEERIDNPAEYGLDPPQSYITVGLKGGRQIGILLGNKTPDGTKHYAQTSGSERLFLIHSSWGDVLNRLVTEPPVVIPTPTPEPTPTAQG